MTMRNPLVGVVVVIAGLVSLTAVAGDPQPSLGQSLDAREELDRSVRPDGRGLPEGSGTARAGSKLYAQQCAHCHGKSGTEGPAPPLAGDPGPLNLSNPYLALSVGGKWPYAPSIFDYVAHAMPPQNPKSLSNDEVYEVTAYILYLNDLVDKDEVMNANSLPTVDMPALQKAVSGWHGWEPPRTAP